MQQNFWGSNSEKAVVAAGALGPEIKRMMAGTAEGRALISIYCFGGMGCQAVKTRERPPALMGLRDGTGTAFQTSCACPQVGGAPDSLLSGFSPQCLIYPYPCPSALPRKSHLGTNAHWVISTIGHSWDMFNNNHNIKDSEH